MAINLHPGQTEIYRDLFLTKDVRFANVSCSRGWGKSYFAGAAASTAVFELMQLPEWVPNKNVYIIAPTYDQVTDIYYPLLAYDLGLEHFAIKSSRELGRFVFPNRVELRLVSYEAVERMRGKGAYFVVWDEITSCHRGISPREAWEGVIQPCIVTRWSEQNAARFNAPSPGRALVISTPKGYDYFYDMFNFQEKDSLWKGYQYDYTTSPLIDPGEVERIKHTVDPLQFAREYMASFKDSGNNVFYMFDRQVHIRSDLEYFMPPDSDGEGGEDVHCSIDFNVGVQATAFHAIRGNEIHTLAEFKGHPDTESLAIAIVDAFPGHRIFAYPDPTGKSRKTSAPVGTTDFSILESYRINIRARNDSPKIVDSVNAVNTKLMTAAGNVGWYIHPDCENFIKSMERTRWVENKPEMATIDKSEGVEHFSDGARYMCEYLYPLRAGKKVAKRGFAF
jgi:hypothetical protein